jgi:hypothetical protein
MGMRSLFDPMAGEDEEFDPTIDAQVIFTDTTIC